MKLPLRFQSDPRDWGRPWLDPPGFFWPNCPCCPVSLQFLKVTGGSAGVSSNNERYDLTSNTWSVDTNYPFAGTLQANGGCTLNNSPYVLSRGFDTSFNVKEIRKYDSGGVWTAKTPSTNGKMFGVCAAIEAIGYVQGAGHSTSGGGSTNASLDAYDSDLDSWSAKTDALSQRLFHQATTLNGLGYSMGGELPGSVFVDDNDEYNPTGDSWSAKVAIPVGDRSHGGLCNISDVGYFCGGRDANGHNDHNAYDPVGDSWLTKTVIPFVALGLFGHVYVALSGKGYIAGGIDAGVPTTVSDEYNPSGDVWVFKSFSTFWGAPVNGGLDRSAGMNI